jgi:surfactin synthase thioesterase subunit
MPGEQPVGLYRFAHAGAGVSAFHGWAARLGPGVLPVPVLLPGRERRRGESRVTTREALLDDVMTLFADAPAGPFVLYGHSLGALVCCTVARAPHEAGRPVPALPALGACPPPHLPPGPPCSGLPRSFFERSLSGLLHAPCLLRPGPPGRRPPRVSGYHRLE